jgi:16S rRNA (uracil1498-N3)-methyltransferase
VGGPCAREDRGYAVLITVLVPPETFAAAADGGSAGVRAPGAPDPQPLVTVEGDAYRHLFRARRLRAGERLRVVDGLGRARWGEILQVGRNAALIELGETAAPNEPWLRLELLVATLRPEPASWLVEKATELGAGAIRFLNTQRGPRSFGAGTAARLRRVAAAAVEQCHRALCPEVTGPHPFDDVPALAAGASRRWLLDPWAPSPAAAGALAMIAASAASAASGAVMEALLIGPEGGWSPEEIEALETGGWQRVSLGPRVLRIETAALAATALLMAGRPTPPDPAPTPV